MAEEGWRLPRRRVVALAITALAFHTTTTACAPDVGIEGEGPPLEKPRKRKTTDTTLPSEEADAGGTSEAGLPRPACIPVEEAFVPNPVNPTAPAQTGACTAAQIDALAAACANDPAASECTTARGQAPRCAACIFSQSSDPTWKVIVVGPESAHFNQAGCMDHVTKEPGCGAAYLNAAACIGHYCDACGTADQDACIDAVVAAECEAHLVSASCVDAVKNSAVGDVCFPGELTPDRVKELFKRMAAVQCPP